MALSTPPSLLIRQSAPFSVSSLSCMATQPVGQNYLSVTEKGQLDMLQPLEKWIFTVPCLRTKNLILACPERFHSIAVSKWDMLFHSQVVAIPMVPHTVTLPKFLNVPEVFFVFPPSSICFAWFLTLLVNLSASHFPLLPLLSLEIFFILFVTKLDVWGLD